MINLLPPEEKKFLVREDYFKIILILGTVFLAVILSLILILLSVRIYISNQTYAEKIISEQERKMIKTAELQELQGKIISANKTLSDLNSFYQNQIYFTGILERISEILPTGVYLTNISFTSLGSGILACNLSGFAPTREILLGFKNDLEKEKIFKEIFFPPANWVKSNNINFDITFKITK